MARRLLGVIGRRSESRHFSSAPPILNQRFAFCPSREEYGLRREFVVMVAVKFLRGVAFSYMAGRDDDKEIPTSTSEKSLGGICSEEER